MLHLLYGTTFPPALSELQGAEHSTGKRHGKLSSMATLAALAGEVWGETSASIIATAAANGSLKILPETSALTIAAKVIVHIDEDPDRADRF